MKPQSLVDEISISQFGFQKRLFGLAEDNIS